MLTKVQNQFTIDEANRFQLINQQVHSRIQQQQIEKSQEELQQTGPLTVTGALYLASLFTAPVPTISASIFGTTLQSIVELAFPKNQTLSAGADIVGSIIGAQTGNLQSKKKLFNFLFNQVKNGIAEEYGPDAARGIVEPKLSNLKNKNIEDFMDDIIEEVPFQYQTGSILQYYQKLTKDINKAIGEVKRSLGTSEEQATSTASSISPEEQATSTASSISPEEQAASSEQPIESSVATVIPPAVTSSAHPEAVEGGGNPPALPPALPPRSPAPPPLPPEQPPLPPISSKLTPKQLAERVFGSQPVQSKIFEATEEATNRAYKISQKALNTTAKGDSDHALSIMDKVTKFSNNIYTAEIYAMLTNPRIPAQKLLTDVINLPVQAAFKGLGVAQRQGLSSGIKTTLAGLNAYRQTFKDAAKLAFQTLKTGEPAFHKMLGITEPIYSHDAFDESIATAGYRWLHAAGQITGLGSRAIISADQFAKALSYVGEIRMGAYYNGLEEAEKQGLVGASKFHFADLYAEQLFSYSPDWLHKQALDKTFQNTFTDQGMITRAVNSLRNAVPGMRNLVPFVRTPMNLAKQGYSITPISPLFNISALSQGGLDRSVALGKWAAGSALYYELAEQAARGNITGDGPPEPYRQHWEGRLHPRSIRINGRWYSYDHLGPFAVPIALAADSYEMYSASKNPDSTVSLINAVGDVFGEQVTHAPFLQEVYNMTHAIDSWKTGSMNKAAKEFIARSASSFIPAPVRIEAQIEDPTIKKAQSMKAMFAENIPGWGSGLGLTTRQDVAPRRNEYGHLQYYPGVVDNEGKISKWHYFANQMNPIPSYSDIQMDDVDKEMARLGYNFRQIPEYWWKHGEHTIPLNAQQKDEWSQFTGNQYKINNRNLHDNMSWLIQQPWYQKMNIADQKHQVHAMYNGYFEAGREYIGQKYGLVQQELEMQRQDIQQETGY